MATAAAKLDTNLSIKNVIKYVEMVLGSICLAMMEILTMVMAVHRHAKSKVIIGVSKILPDFQCAYVL